jgi:hypothetical protein
MARGTSVGHAPSTLRQTNMVEHVSTILGHELAPTMRCEGCHRIITFNKQSAQAYFFVIDLRLVEPCAWQAGHFPGFESFDSSNEPARPTSGRTTTISCPAAFAERRT